MPTNWNATSRSWQPFVLIVSFLLSVAVTLLLLEHLKLHTLGKSRYHFDAISRVQIYLCYHLKTARYSHNNNSVASSPQAKYTDRVAASCWRSWCQLLRIEGVAWSVQRIPAAVNLSFQDRSRYFFIQVAPQLFLTRLSGPRSRPTTSQKIW
jgi:hypothetical protein